MFYDPPEYKQTYLDTITYSCMKLLCHDDVDVIQFPLSTPCNTILKIKADA